ncbi:polyprenyl diphosphate synthase [Clostridium luticellarii]|jgi:undecaprenyl diphosphate synthase|uniref:Isoprenyl transferase n=1 Tax=Clostridium luticellarii TaxID=1691940 RepID=A0A2T0BQ72_9CLOT|nr:polyprenyl diphosphate synthase [Clostridium luticellarii]MCI1944467.1 polyprenyl diphosphate synthase [Clostridium luticellarii]MCI1967966.1 polyprenyl diphosphate synthase [Clostridium luticellarii]MCI1995095.1 polyprenyl diphosphate synthase [Clostridium luticellarii]MCI2039254.1 polyprenyl diphosphate synthase [Clostridium luticellarii]PRR86034.1 Isoprenyl transferase [Clostridium luticellarii]
MKLPNHIGIIPDGNRRWACKNNMEKEKGYEFGLISGIKLFKCCEKLGIKELTYYGFTTDNTKRPSIQRKAFTKACVKAVKMLFKENASLLVVGNTNSPMFPKELLPYTVRKRLGNGGMKLNFLVNYGWEWDLGKSVDCHFTNRSSIISNLNSHDISRVDLIIRWGGRRRLSGFLPVQSVYSDFYIIDDYWPDFKNEHLMQALEWYNHQDITLGG